MSKTSDKNTYESYLNEQLSNSQFRKAWKGTELEYFIAKQIIDRRHQKKMSQRELQTSQAVVARLEGMTGNPTLKLLSKVALALGKKLEVKFV